MLEQTTTVLNINDLHHQGLKIYELKNLGFLSLPTDHHKQVCKILLECMINKFLKKEMFCIRAMKGLNINRELQGIRTLHYTNRPLGKGGGGVMSQKQNNLMYRTYSARRIDIVSLIFLIFRPSIIQIEFHGVEIKKLVNIHFSLT